MKFKINSTFIVDNKKVTLYIDVVLQTHNFLNIFSTVIKYVYFIHDFSFFFSLYYTKVCLITILNEIHECIYLCVSCMYILKYHYTLL